MGLSSKYESLQIAKGFAEHYRKIAVIVGTSAQEETQDSAVHGANQGVMLLLRDIELEY